MSAARRPGAVPTSTIFGRATSLPRTARAFFLRDFQEEASYRLSFAMSFAGLFLASTVWFFLGRFVQGVAEPGALSRTLDGLDYYSFTLVGLMIGRFIDVAQSSYSSKIRDEQTTGTLEAMLVTPTKLGHIILAGSTWSYVFALLQAGAYLFFGVFVFGVRLNVGSVVGALAAVLFSVLALSGIGILSAAFVLYFKRGNPIDYAMSMAAMLFGNMYIPVRTMPAELAWISKCIPVTYAVDAVRGALLQGKVLAELLPDLLALLGFAAVLLPLGLAGAWFAVRRAKQEGTLVQY